MPQLQFIQISPEQLQEAILSGVKKQLEELKKEYQPKEPEEYLTRLETADLLKVDPSTIFNWTKKGLIKSYGLSGRVYYKRSEIEKNIIVLK